jgi:hypothetical protein
MKCAVINTFKFFLWIRRLVVLVHPAKPDWPQYAELSHGSAGEYQRLAEQLATQLGVHDEYEHAVHTGTGPISEMARRVEPSMLRLRNGRAGCPCGRRDRRAQPLLRRDCWADQLDCLAVLEFQRRLALDQFWSSFDEADRCCGTMWNCPLRRSST